MTNAVGRGACLPPNAISTAGNGSKGKPLCGKPEFYGEMGGREAEGTKKESKDNRNGGRYLSAAGMRVESTTVHDLENESASILEVRRWDKHPCTVQEMVCKTQPSHLVRTSNTTSIIIVKAFQILTMFMGTLRQISTWHTSSCIISRLTQIFRSCVWCVLLFEFWQKL